MYEQGPEVSDDLATVMSATSLPGNTDTDFAGGTEGMAVQSDDVQSEALAALEENLKSTDEEDLYILMIN